MELVPLEEFQHTNYKISTITVTGCINSVLNLQEFYNRIDIDKLKNVIYVEYGANKSDQCFKGTKTIKLKKKTPVQKKRFDNQLTLHITDEFDQKYNVKLFRNGNLQMTGVKDLTKGYVIVDDIIDLIKSLDDQKSEEKIVEDVKDLRNCNYSARLINCDFRVNYKINRANLHNLLTRTYKLTCSYEPCIYQGVKLSFYMNSYSKDGICACENGKKCSGKGKKTICKKITVAIFQSGCITITGANTIQQVDFMYNFMVNILKTHVKDIHQVQYVVSSLSK